MKVPYSWLREWVDLTASAEDVAALMSVRGFAVEGLEHLPGGDVVLDFEVTANRPDCMSVRGIAREVATAFDLPLLPALKGDALTPTARPAVAIDIERPDLCARYAGALATVTVAPSPTWLQDRLRACGVRPINDIVDVTNYVLLELGQPMHAFDVGMLAGPAIHVRTARPGETLRTLDGQDRTLTPEMLVIADAARATAVAGVMGGAASEVTSGTTRILLESAYFNPLSVRRTSKALGLKTEASMRFERGADPALPAVAMARACALLREIGAGQPDGGILDRHPVPHDVCVLPLRRSRLQEILGVAVPDTRVVTLLEALGFGVAPASHGWNLTIPSARVDVVREVDIIEEVARHYGFDKIPATFPALRTPPAPPDPRAVQARHLRGVMVGAGFFEAMTFGFISASAAAPFAQPDAVVELANPLSETFAVLRPSLLPGLVSAVAHNRRREQPDVRLFEVGARFSRTGGERRSLAFAWTGASDPAHWSGLSVGVTFFDAAAVAERVGLALELAVSVEPLDVPWLVRGQSAVILHDGTTLGTVGRLLPAIAEAHGLTDSDAVFVGDIDLDAATRQAQPTRVTPLPKFPSVSRDLALLLDDTLPSATLRATIRAAAPQTLTHVREFDRYHGKGIPDGKVSLAVRLTFRSVERTLTDAEVQDAMTAVLAAVQSAHGAVQR